VGLELGLKAPCTTFRLVYVSEISDSGPATTTPPPLRVGVRQQLGATPTGTARHGPGQPRAGHARTTGARTVGKDWLARIGGSRWRREQSRAEQSREQRRGEEEGRADRQTDRPTDRQTDTHQRDGNGAGNDGGSSHACMQQRPPLESSTANPRRATQQQQQQQQRQPPPRGEESAEKSAAAKADGRMKRLKRAAQEAQPEEGWWRARGEHRGWKNNDA
jgi:hypothetical protein